MTRTASQTTLAQDERRVAAWAEVRELLELQLAPLGQRAIEMLRPCAGEHVLDIGCGAGETTRALASAVAPDGMVVGIDLSAAILSFARRGNETARRVRFIEADAQAFAFEPQAFDAAYSRFGVMFFADPILAFQNIRRSLKPHGRLVFVCWRALAENPLDRVPLEAAIDHLPSGQKIDPAAPGPFAFADPDRVRRILSRAGFADIKIISHDAQVGSGDIDAMLAVCTRVGALGSILRQHPELRPDVLPAVRSALARHQGPSGVTLKAATWIVKARANPGADDNGSHGTGRAAAKN